MNTLLPAMPFIVAGSYSSSNTGLGNPVTFSTAPGRVCVATVITTAPSTSDNATATLDVFLQHSPNSSIVGIANATWDDFLHLPQITGPGPKAVIGAWAGQVAPSSSLNMHTAGSLALPAGQVIHGANGGTWRAAFVIAGTSPVAPSSSRWAFSVVVQPYGE